MPANVAFTSLIDFVLDGSCTDEQRQEFAEL